MYIMLYSQIRFLLFSILTGSGKSKCVFIINQNITNRTYATLIYHQVVTSMRGIPCSVTAPLTGVTNPDAPYNEFNILEISLVRDS